MVVKGQNYLHISKSYELKLLTFLGFKNVNKIINFNVKKQL